MNTLEQTESIFKRDVARSLTCLRTELAEVIAAVPSGVSRAVDLHRTLRIDRKLSWKIFKIANATDPVAVGMHVPSRAGLRSFFRAVMKQGVPSKLIDAASRAADDFEKVMTKHAGDRATFDTMVSALGSDEAAEQLDLVHRRLGFRAQRHHLGIQAKTQLKLLAIQPCDDAAAVDSLRVEGFVDIRQLRGDAPLIISRSMACNDAGEAFETHLRALEPTGSTDDLGLLREFCSEPLPEFRFFEAEHGFIEGEILSHDVGNRAAVTCMVGYITRDAIFSYRTESNLEMKAAVAVRTPCEVLIFDLMVREDTFGPLTPKVSVYSEHTGKPLWEGDNAENNRLPGHYVINYLGKGPSVLYAPDVPRYAEMGRYVFQCAGWDGTRFDVYRCRIEYPIMPTSVAICNDLPEAPKT